MNDSERRDKFNKAIDNLERTHYRLSQRIDNAESANINTYELQLRTARREVTKMIKVTKSEYYDR
jgi:hypothetical protein